MRITPDAEFKHWILEKIESREFKERSGVHCSDLIYCLNKQALRRLQPLPIDESTLLLFSLGYAIQRWLTGQDKDEEEVCQDGIIVTKDALYKGAPWEVKATYTSSARDVNDNVAWIRQIKAQCYTTGTDHAYLSRCEVMGDWKFPKKGSSESPKRPTLSTYKLVFTPDELCKHWEWLKHRRDQFQQILDSQALLPKIEAVPSGQYWECGMCAYNNNPCPYGGKEEKEE